MKADVDENGDMPSDYYDRMVSVCATEGAVEWTNPDGDEYWLTPLDLCTEGAKANIVASLLAFASLTYVMAN